MNAVIRLESKLIAPGKPNAVPPSPRPFQLVDHSQHANRRAIRRPEGQRGMSFHRSKRAPLHTNFVACAGSDDSNKGLVKYDKSYEKERKRRGKSGESEGKRQGSPANDSGNLSGSIEDNHLELDWRDFATPAEKGWSIEEPTVFYFAIASAYSLMLNGKVALEEVLRDGISRAERGGRSRDVWLVMEPSFLSHPSLSSLKSSLKSPTAAIVSTNGAWMMSIVKELLPQACIGKFSAPSPSIPNPFKSDLKPGAAVIGGGGVWH